MACSDGPEPTFSPRYSQSEGAWFSRFGLWETRPESAICTTQERATLSSRLSTNRGATPCCVRVWLIWDASHDSGGAREACGRQPAARVAWWTPAAATTPSPSAAAASNRRLAPMRIRPPLVTLPPGGLFAYQRGISCHRVSIEVIADLVGVAGPRP